jgi:O-antigen ligase
LRVAVAVSAGGAVVALVTMAMLAVEPKFGVAAIGGLLVVPLALASLSAAIAMLVAVQFLAALPAFGIAATSLLALTAVRWVAWPAARERIRARRWPARWPIWIAALLLWLALSVVWARRPDVSLGALPAWAVSALVAVVVATGVGTRRDVEHVMRGFVWGATASVAIGLVATVWAHGGSIYSHTFFEDRLQGGAKDPNFLAAGVVAAIALAGGLMATDRGWRRLADAGAIGVLVLGLAATQSRGGAIAAVVAAVVAVALNPGRRGRMTVGVTALAALIVAGLALSPGGLARLSTADREGSGRRDLWIVATRVVEARPLTGVGLDNFRTVAPDYVRRPGTLRFVDLIAERPHEAHDTYLQALADTGIVGLTLFAAVVLASLGALARAVGRGVPLARPALIATLGMLAALVFLSDGSDPLLWTLFGLGPALLALERAPRRR